MKSKQLRFYVLIALVISSSLNVGMFFGNLMGITKSEVNSSANNSEAVGLTNFDGNFYVLEGNFSGSGNLLCAKQYGQLLGNQQGLKTNTSLQVNYADWNGTAIQIIASQMEANASLPGELNLLNAITLPNGVGPTTVRYVQEIQIPFSKTFLKSIKPYLYIIKYHVGTDLYVEIWNATYSGGYKPNQQLSQTGFNLGDAIGTINNYTWALLPFNTPLLLDASQTVGNRFYIALTENGPQGYIYWYGANDSLETNEFSVCYVYWRSGQQQRFY